MIRKVAIYFASMLGVFVGLAFFDPDGFVFHPQRAAVVLVLMALGAFAFWVRYDWAMEEDQDEP